MKRKSKGLLVGIAYFSFIGMGLPGAMLGVAWPSIRGTFDLPLDAVGMLLVTEMIGYLVASFYSGPLISKVGIGKLLLTSVALRLVGLFGYSLSPAWWIIVLLGLVTGLGGGVLDAGLNTYFATNHSANLMNWLHACFGIGATLGPVVMRAVLSGGWSWRFGFAIVGLLHVLYTIGFAATLNRWALKSSGVEDDVETRDVRARSMRSIDTLKLPLVWIGVVLFFLFTGVENTTGQWAYTLFTEARSVNPDVAGFWASAYWGSLTVGRIIFGLVTDRLGVTRSLRLVMIGAMCGAILIWGNFTGWLSFVGLALMGFSVSPLFPLSISATPGRVGAEHAANAIGFQIASGGLGFSLLPALAGVLAENVGLEVIGPFLLVAAGVMFLLHEVSVRRGT
ncbi:MAG: MFS transporter [Anaerolineae bacterium]|jgi:fucose permease